MQKVGINTKRRLAALVFGDWNLVLFGKINQLGTACQIPFAPGGDDFDVRVQCIGRQLESYLVIALAGRAVSDCICALDLRNLDQAL